MKEKVTETLTVTVTVNDEKWQFLKLNDSYNQRLQTAVRENFMVPETITDNLTEPIRVIFNDSSWQLKIDRNFNNHGEK